LNAWGEDLTILVPADFAYLPGFFAVANSALENGFRGRVEVLVRGGLDPQPFPEHPQLRMRAHAGFPGTHPEYVHRLNALTGLDPGRYLLLDADIVIERPAGILLAALDEGIIVSTEPEPKYDPQDVLLWRQCRQLDLPTALHPLPYVNCGLLGFILPRDADLISAWAALSARHWAALSARHLDGLVANGEPPDWFFPEQDVLNVLLRQSGRSVFSISPRQLEIGAFTRIFWDRPFPWTLQSGLRPADQLKYIIHGACLRRPWLMEKRNGVMPRLVERHGLAAAWRRWRGKLTPYERAWAYYTCREDLAIPLSFWADRHGFAAHRSPLWRVAHGLK